MKKNNSKIDKGMGGLLGSYTEALEDNSEIIYSLLNALVNKDLSEKQKKELRRISKEFNRINNTLENLK